MNESVTSQPAPEMTMSDARMDESLVSRINEALDGLVRRPELPANLVEAMRYALLSPGKRLRPVLTIKSAQAVNGSEQSAMTAACAVEMIHAFSLVHDDLPALDNDDLRRGRPTTHVRFGEAMGLLAGDGLMSLAFEIVVSEIGSPPLAAQLITELARGTTNMIGGQVFDTLGGFPDPLTDRERMELVHRNKTGALLRASCRMGVLCAAHELGLDQARKEHALNCISVYGEAIGLMFQVVDDLIDVEQSAEHAGKRVSKDEEAGKLTYPSVLGVQGSRTVIEELHEQATQALEALGGQTTHLQELTDYLASRTR